MKRMEKSLGEGHPLRVEQVLIAVKAGLKAIRYAGSTRRDFGELSFAGLFSGTPEARMKVKTSISGAPTLDLELFPWINNTYSHATYSITHNDSSRRATLTLFPMERSRFLKA